MMNKIVYLKETKSDRQQNIGVVRTNARQMSVKLGVIKCMIRTYQYQHRKCQNKIKG